MKQIDQSVQVGWNRGSIEMDISFATARGCAILFHLSVSYPPFQGIFQDLSKALIALIIFQRPALSNNNQVRANDLQQVEE